MTRRLAYPDPPLTDGRIALRPWAEGDLECVRLAATDPRIPPRTTVPADFTTEAGLAFVRRQSDRVRRGEGVSQAVVDAGTDRALGLLWVEPDNVASRQVLSAAGFHAEGRAGGLLRIDGEPVDTLVYAVTVPGP